MHNSGAKITRHSHFGQEKKTSQSGTGDRGSHEFVLSQNSVCLNNGFPDFFIAVMVQRLKFQQLCKRHLKCLDVNILKMDKTNCKLNIFLENKPVWWTYRFIFYMGATKFADLSTLTNQKCLYFEELVGTPTAN